MQTHQHLSISTKTGMPFNCPDVQLLLLFSLFSEVVFGCVSIYSATLNHNDKVMGSTGRDDKSRSFYFLLSTNEWNDHYDNVRDYCLAWENVIIICRHSNKRIIRFNQLHWVFELSAKRIQWKAEISRLSVIVQAIPSYEHISCTIHSRI